MNFNLNEFYSQMSCLVNYSYLKRTFYQSYVNFSGQQQQKNNKQTKRVGGNPATAIQHNFDIKI